MPIVCVTAFAVPGSTTIGAIGAEQRSAVTATATSRHGLGELPDRVEVGVYVRGCVRD